MTTPSDAADAVLDEVMVLGFELCAIAKPKNAPAFVELLSRFTHAVIREAFEHQDEIRARLSMPMPKAVDDDPRGQITVSVTHCPYCTEAYTGPQDSHACKRRRELGLDTSTGAAANAPRAEQPNAKRAAIEPPAAPSIEYTAGAVSVLKPPGGALAKPGQGTEETGTDRPAAPISIAAPASSKPPPSLSEPAADGAGTSPAGPDSGAEGLQRKPKRGGQPALTDDARRQLCAEYDQACEVNGGKAPYGWISGKCTELGLAVSTVRRALGLDVAADGRPASYVRNGHATLPAATAPREHTNGHGCWCRKGPNNSATPWCSNKPSPAVLPGLRSRVAPTVRNERFSGERARVPDAEVE